MCPPHQSDRVSLQYERMLLTLSADAAYAHPPQLHIRAVVLHRIDRTSPCVLQLVRLALSAHHEENSVFPPSSEIFDSVNIYLIAADPAGLPNGKRYRTSISKVVQRGPCNGRPLS